MKLQKTINANFSKGLFPLIIGHMEAFTSFRDRPRRVYEMARKTILRSVFIILSCVCFLPNAARASPFTVNTTSDTIVTGACDNPPTPGCSLRGAINLANTTIANDLINFNIPVSDPSCANGLCTINLTSELPVISESLQLIGPGADKLTIRNAANFGYPVFRVTVSTGSVVFFDLTVSNGNSSQSTGGGIAAHGSSSNLTVSVIRCVISGNTASNGGGIYNTADMLIRDSLINGNTGGGIFNNAGVMKIINSTITGNNGTGVLNSLGFLNLTNSTVSSNGGISGGIGITNFGNTAIFNVKSSIIARNGGAFFSDISGAFVSWGFNLVSKRDAGTGFSETTDLTGTIDAPLDPRFDPGGLKDNGGATKTITLMSNSPAIDKGSSNGLNGFLEFDQRLSRRLFDNPAVQNATGGDGTDIGALERRSSPYDFDGDGRTDVGIFRPADGSWWYVRSSDNQFRVFSFGTATDIITPGDFTGDGRADIAVFRPSNGSWYIQRSEDNSFFSFPFGLAGDIPASADYDRDGKTDAAVFRPSSGTWFILNSGGSGTSIAQFGSAEDKPVPADYDGDGRADIAIFRPSDGSWWYLQSSNSQFKVYRFGVGTDKPVQGDYTGDGKADIAVFRPTGGEWFFQRSENNSYYSVPFGTAGDVLAPGDYDGDGRFDTAVFRPSTGNWFINGSGAGSMILTFGTNGDRPIPNAFVP